LSDCASGRKTSTDRSATSVERPEPDACLGHGQRTKEIIAATLHGEDLDHVADLQIVGKLSKPMPHSKPVFTSTRHP
jgi:hypothetical protein